MASSIVQELNFPQLNIPITITEYLPVNPSGPIPASPGDTLYLSNLDDMIGARVFTPTIYFFGKGDGFSCDVERVWERLGDALARVLVPYYPLSGRLREAENGKLEVYFGPDQGALMVRAYTELSLDDLGEVTAPNPGWEPLIFKFPNEEFYKVLEMPLLIAQVTHFACGGFSLGLRLCHCICDGLGAMQFVSAWAATAKAGELVTDPKPCWDRELLKPREPPLVEYPHTEFMRIDDGSSLTMSLWWQKRVMKCYRVSGEFQARVKALAQTPMQRTCSTFDAMAAHIWKSWVTALDVKPLDYNLRLTFSVNARQKLQNPPLNDGFYGNVICAPCATSSVNDLIHSSLADTTRLVREARVGVTEEYVRSTIDYMDLDRPTRLEFGGKLTITQWTRFSMYEIADFGWGRPIYAGPIDLTPTPQVCVLLPEGDADHSGSMIVCICLPESATDKFAETFCSLGSSL